MRTLHTYGDSHASYFGGWTQIQIPGLTVETHWLGPMLMYSFGRDAPVVVSNQLGKNDIACFCFGEIDCRCHINKYEPGWKNNINNVVDNYFKAIQKNVETLKCQTWVFNVVPPIARERQENQWLEQNPEFPSLGTDAQRLEYTQYMNEQLQRNCRELRFSFLDVYSSYADSQGFFIRELSDGKGHIANPIYLTNGIEKLLGKNESLFEKIRACFR